ncbi:MULTISPECIES: hypothetical protein [unclassified Micromonospora]|uniref:hypothetical protein n=1 Tax=unclassified Micromonospora TaxID=2617518 RepID=UPI003637213C
MAPWQDWKTIARPDVVISDGRPVVVEMNGDSPAGLFSLHDALAEVQAQLLVELGIQVEAAAPRALQTLIDTMPLTPGVDRVAVCCWRHEIADAPPVWSYGSFVKGMKSHGIDA